MSLSNVRYYVNKDPSTDTTFVSALTSAVENLIAEAENGVTEFRKFIRIAAKTGIGGQIAVETFDIIVNEDRATATIAGAVVDLTVAGITAALIALIGIEGIAAVAVATAATAIYSWGLEKHVDEALDDWLGTQDKDIELRDANGSLLGGAFYNDGYSDHEEPEAVKLLLQKAIAGEFGTNVILSEGMYLPISAGQSQTYQHSYTILGSEPLDKLVAATGDTLSNFLERYAWDELLQQQVSNSGKYLDYQGQQWLFVKDTDKLAVHTQDALSSEKHDIDFDVDAIEVNGRTFSPDVGASVNLTKDNLLIGGDQADTINGDAGNDVIYGGDGADTLLGGLGNDILFAAASGTTNQETADSLSGEAGDDVLIGSFGDNLLDGGTGNDHLFASDGDDTLVASEGFDIMVGSLGVDTADYSKLGKSVEISISNDGATKNLYAATPWNNTLNIEAPTFIGVEVDGGAFEHALHGVERIIGSRYADTIELDALDAAELAEFEYIDLADGNVSFDDANTLDLSDMVENVSADLRTENQQSVSLTETPENSLTFKNVRVVRSGAGDDILYGTDSDELWSRIEGGGGNDRIFATRGSHQFDGQDGEDIADYSQLGSSVIGRIGWGAEADSKIYGSGEDIIFDELLSIEKIFATKQNDEFRFHKEIGEYNINFELLINANDGDSDLADFSRLSEAVSLNSLAPGLIKLGESNLLLQNFEKIVGTAQADNINLKQTFWVPGEQVPETGITQVTLDGGDGADEISVTGAGITAYGGAGDDNIKVSGWGSQVFGGAGADEILAGFQTAIMDGEADDRLFAGSFEIKGAIRNKASESAYAVDGAGVKYGLNDAGELIVELPFTYQGYDYQTYVMNYNGGPGVADDTMGIEVAEMEIGAYRLLFDEIPHGGIIDTWETFNYLYKKATGNERSPGVDPLVLDLDGDGLEFIPQTSVSPTFDIDGDGFAERTGWVKGDDGFLVRDANGDGKINDISEMFGNPSQGGFDELATLDSNSDGKIDNTDAAWSELQVWQDTDQDGETDAGELKSLDEVGIASIDLASTPTEVVDNFNIVTATGSFTRTDGSTGEIADVTFRVDNYRSTYAGVTSVSPDAALLPNAKGYGELPDLQVAMSRSPSLLAAVQNNIANLDQPDLAHLRDAVMPILSAWANWDGQAPAGYDDIAVLVTGDAGSLSVGDYAFEDTDPQTGDPYWRLASGNPVLDANGNEILRPTFQQILDQQSQSGEWRRYTGEQLAFLERYLGEPVPFGQLANDASSIEGVGGYLDILVSRLDVLAVRMAMQGPLQNFFPGIDYDVESDTFSATTERQLIPAFEALFQAAPADDATASGFLQNWADFFKVVIGDFDRGASHLTNSFAFLFTNIVAAKEAVGLTLGAAAAAEALGIPEDIIVEGSGEIAGTVENDIFYMDSGNQTAKGGLGHDVYVFGRNFGQDVIDDFEAAGQAHSLDVIRFANYNRDDLTFERDGVDLVIRVAGTENAVTVKGQFNGRIPNINGGGNLGDETWIDEIIFADGTVWDRVDLARAVAKPLVTDDTLTGTDAIDFLDGGAGDDRLEGGSDADHYIFKAGYSHDVIHDSPESFHLSGPDSVEFGETLSPDNLIFSRDGNSNDLTISSGDGQDTLVIEGQFNKVYTGPLGEWWQKTIENFYFTGTGEILDYRDVMARISDQWKTDGNDVIYGFDIEDTLDGGAGDDYLQGGNENDIYLFGLGYGNDVIEDDNDELLSGQTDTLRFQPGVLPSDVTFSRDGDSNDLLITLSDGSTLTIRNQFEVAVTGVFGNQWFDRIETIEFADAPEATMTAADVMQALLDQYSTTGDDIIHGFAVKDTLDGGAGNDYLAGGDDGDTYVFDAGYGNDTVYDDQTEILLPDNDKVQFGAGITTENLILSRNGDDLIIQVNGTADTLTIQGQFATSNLNNRFTQIEEFHFTDGTVWSFRDVEEKLLVGTDGDDTIIGYFDQDTLDGGAGNDTLKGGDGGDSYVFDRGYGNDTVHDEQTSVFNKLPDKVLFGAGIAVSDISLARGGAQSRDLIISVANATDTLTIKDFFFTKYQEVEEFHFQDGSVWTLTDIYEQLTQGTDGDDTLAGSDGNDILDGGLGNDRLEGGNGNDTYVFKRGFGQDTIRDYQDDVFASSIDRVVFGPDISPGDLRFTVVGSLRRDLLIEIVGTTDSLLIEDHFDMDFTRVEEFQFADGSLLSHQDIADIMFTGTDGADTITGSDGDDVIRGMAGDDTLYGDDANDTLFGGDGDDHLEGDYGYNDLYGETGNDTLVADGYGGTYDGGAGDDLLKHVRGENTFVGGDGVDTLSFNSYDEGDINLKDKKGKIGSYDIAISDVENVIGSKTHDTIIGDDGDNVIDGSGGDDVLAGGAGNDTLTGGIGLDSYDGGNGLDTVDFSYSGADWAYDLSEGTAKVGTTTEQLTSIENVAGGSGDETFVGTVNANVFTGRAGNDMLDGGYGVDTAVFSGDIAGYEVTGQGGGVFTVKDVDLSDGDEGTDTVSNVENLQFADQILQVIEGPSHDALDGIVSMPIDESVSGQVQVEFGQDFNEGLTYEVYDSGKYGAVTVDANGRYTYAAAGGFTGADSFQIKVTDDQGRVDVSTISVDVRSGETISDATFANTTWRSNRTYYSDYWKLGPATSSLNDGNYVVVWPQYGADGSADGVYARLYNQSGEAVSPELDVNSYTSLTQSLVDVAGTTNGGFVVTWTSERQDGSYDGVYAQRFDAEGAKVGAEQLINSTTSSYQRRSSVTATSDGGYIVAWESYLQDGSSFGIYARKFDENGNAVTAELPVNSHTDGYQRLARVSELSDGRFVVVWDSDGQDGSNQGIYGQVLASDGSKIGGEFQVHDNVLNSQIEPDIAALNDGGFVVVWQDGSEAFSAGAGHDVAARIYDANGQPVGSSFRVNNTLYDGNQTSPAIEALPDGGFFVVWGSEADNSVYGQKFDASGNSSGAPITIAETTVTEDWEPQLTVLEDGGVAVTWQFSQSSGGYTGVKTRVIFGDHANSLFGTNGADVLVGNDADNILAGDAANDMLTGGSGADRFQFGFEGGNDQVTDAETDDVVELGVGVEARHVWFGQEGDDLAVRLMGSQDSVLIDDWFAAESQRVGEFALKSGETLSVANVQALVDAMASFSAGQIAEGNFDINSTEYNNVQSAIASSWQSN